MAKRRARTQTDPVEVPDFMPVSARVAWTYLGVLLAAVAAGVLVAMANQLIAPLFCPSEGGLVDDAGAVCRLGVAIWSSIAAFLLCLAPALLALKLDWWLWAATFTGAALLVVTDAVHEWWWWVLAALVPAAAALISADWDRGPVFRRRQLIGLLVLAAAALAALAWWYLNG